MGKLAFGSGVSGDFFFESLLVFNLSRDRTYLLVGCPTPESPGIGVVPFAILLTFFLPWLASRFSPLLIGCLSLQSMRYTLVG